MQLAYDFHYFLNSKPHIYPFTCVSGNILNAPCIFIVPLKSKQMCITLIAFHILKNRRFANDGNWKERLGITLKTVVHKMLSQISSIHIA